MADSLQLAGVIPVLPVPFCDDQSLDLEAFAAEVRWAADRPVDGLALFGLASEYWKLGDTERLALVETLVESVGRRKPVVVSVTDATRFHAEQFARRFAAMGADALVVMPPHFMSPKPEKIIDHCRAVADAVAPLPVVVQYSPAYIGVSIPVDVFVKLHEKAPNVGYVKVEPRPPGPMVEALRAASDGRIRCLIGQGGLTLADCRSRGVVGLMPGVAVPEVYRKLWDGLAAESVAPEILDLNDRMVALMSHIVPTIDMWIAAEKHMLAWRNVIDRPLLRDPSSTPDEGFLRHLRRCFDRLCPHLDDTTHALSGRTPTETMPNAGTRKTCLITGASRGIGLGIAQHLDRCGYRLALTCRNHASLETLRKELASFSHTDHLPILCDVGVTEQVEAMFGRIDAAFGRLDALVVNAGIHRQEPSTEIPADAWDRLFAIDVRGAMLCCRETARRMIGRGGGIVVIGSIAGERAAARRACYCAGEGRLARVFPKCRPGMGAGRHPREYRLARTDRYRVSQRGPAFQGPGVAQRSRWHGKDGPAGTPRHSTGCRACR